MKTNLSLAGSEIINESKSKFNNSNISTTSPTKEQKLIIKSYKILDSQSSNSNNNSSKNKDVSSEKRVPQTKKLNSLDLSKIKYNDGYILTDATNSNPGFGLWALKTGSKDNDQNVKKNSLDNNNDKRKFINNISTNNNNITSNTNMNKISITTNNISNNKINDKSQSISFNSKNEEIKKRNKLLIENLKMKCNDLESKCTNLISNLGQKNYMCNNSIKLKREYEKILQDNIRDTKLIKEKASSLSLENAKLNNVYKNIENELNRLLNVMRTDKENMQKLKEEFNSRLIEEENERQRLSALLKEVDERVKFFEEEANEKFKHKDDIDNSNSNINKMEIVSKKESEAKKEFEEENLNDVILELELKICEMKKKINSQEEENNKLRKILKFKEDKNGREKYQLTNLNFLLKFKKENQKNDLITVSKQDKLIKELKKKIRLKSNNKMSKSVSLKKVKI